METSTAIMLGLAGGAVAWWLLKRPTTPAPAPTPSYGSGGSYNPAGMYTGSDLGPLAPILSAPVFKQAYDVLAPINDKLVQPAVNAINRSGPVMKFNELVGGPPKVTVNPDGTIHREAPSNWYSDNIGKPISQAGTALVHAIGDINPF